MPPNTRAYRLACIDILRGAVIVIMALDHVRDFTMLHSHQDPMRDPHVTTALFFTRWITHFCAPTFTLLAGVSAGLMRERKSSGALGAFLLQRGLWLIAVEIALVSSAITMAPFGGAHVIIMQTLWAIGGSMIVLAGVQFLGTRASLLIGATIVLLHNSLDSIWPAGFGFNAPAPWWVTLHTPAPTALGSWHVFWAYPLLPWIGVMCLGFGAAPLFELPAPVRNRRLKQIGAALIGFFIVLRLSNLYGDPHPWHSQPGGAWRTLLAVLNTQKYPPSLLYLAMTLGPAAILCALSEKFPARVQAVLMTYGRVPFAFYVVHFWVIRVLGLLLGEWQGYSYAQLIGVNGQKAPDFGLPLPGVYMVWLAVVALLYPFCRQIAAIKARRTNWWLSYL